MPIPILAVRTDALAMLVRAADEHGRSMTDRELRDQLMTLLVAGHDTTATGLSWALERLTRHPAVLAKAVRRGGRGRPVRRRIPRRRLQGNPADPPGRVRHRPNPDPAPVDLAGYRLPAGRHGGPGPGLVHAIPSLYPNPERFEPDRMLGGTSLRPPHGSRSGAATDAVWVQRSALTEMRVVLREILLRVDLATTAAAG